MFSFRCFYDKNLDSFNFFWQIKIIHCKIKPELHHDYRPFIGTSTNKMYRTEN